MLNKFISCLKNCFFGAVPEVETPNIVRDPMSNNTNSVTRDELSKRVSKNKAEKKRVSFVDSEPVIITSHKDDHKKDILERKSCVIAKDEEIMSKGVLIRVKVKMTKEEANRMLSHCKDGKFLEFKNVADELEHVPSARLRVLTRGNDSAAIDQSLKTISEDI